MRTSSALRRGGVMAVTAGALAIGGMAGTASAATPADAASPKTRISADTTKCGRHVAWPGAPSWISYPVRSATLHGRTVQLKNTRTTDWSYAYVARGYRSGDRVWVDRSRNSGHTWFQCGPFWRGHSNQVPNLGVLVRACVDVRVGTARRHRCTGWYYDKD